MTKKMTARDAAVAEIWLRDAHPALDELSLWVKELQSKLGTPVSGEWVLEKANELRAAVEHLPSDPPWAAAGVDIQFDRIRATSGRFADDLEAAAFGANLEAITADLIRDANELASVSAASKRSVNLAQERYRAVLGRQVT